MGTKTTGWFAISSPPKAPCALLLQIVVGRNLRQQRGLHCVDEAVRGHRMSEEPRKNADERDRQQRRRASGQVRSRWNIAKNGV
jgi:hypothetical protein